MKHITIEKAVLFLKVILEDMINIRFTTGGSVAVFESVNNDMTPLMVLTWGAREVEEEWIKKQEAK